MEKTGFAKEAEQIRREENAWTLFQGAAKAFEKLGLKRLHLHNLGYHLLLLSKPYAVPPEKVVDAVLYSSVAATSKAILGRQISAEELHVSLKTPLSQIGFAQMALFAQKSGMKDAAQFLETGIWDAGKFFVLVVPGQYAHAPASTVGLGDVVSSCSLLAEAETRRVVEERPRKRRFHQQSKGRIQAKGKIGRRGK